MNQTIVDYLQKNKDSYTKEALIAKLKASGFSEGDIDAGVRWVYENKKAPNYVALGVIWALILFFPAYILISLFYGAGYFAVGFYCGDLIQEGIFREGSAAGIFNFLKMAMLEGFLIEGIFRVPVAVLLGVFSGKIANKIGNNNRYKKIITVTLVLFFISVASLAVAIIDKYNTDNFC